MGEVTGEAAGEGDGVDAGVGEVVTGIVDICSGPGVCIGVSTTIGLIDGFGVGVAGSVGVGVVRAVVVVELYMHLNVPLTQLTVTDPPTSFNNVLGSMNVNRVSHPSSLSQWIVSMPTMYSPVNSAVGGSAEKVIHSFPLVNVSQPPNGKLVVFRSQFVTFAHVESYVRFICPP